MKPDACLICGKPLVYTEAANTMKCSICGDSMTSNACCEAGHFVCDKCHGSGASSVIRGICLGSSSENPYEIALEILNSPTVHMHGPEHHTIVGAALAAAYKNAGADINLQRVLNIIEERGGKVPGGICGNWGCCGAAVGAGVFLSVVTKTSPLSGESWGMCNRLTSECLSDIGSLGGPRCCKRNLGIAIKRTVLFVERELGVSMEKPDISCKFSGRNSECIKGKCPFYMCSAS